MIKTTLGQLSAAEEALGRVAAAPRAPGKLHYQLFKLVEEVSEHLTYFHSQRTKIASEMGTSKPDGSWTIPPEVLPAFIERVRPVAEIEVALKAQPFPYNELGTISIQDTMLLKPILSFPEDANDVGNT